MNYPKTFREWVNAVAVLSIILGGILFLCALESIIEHIINLIF